MRNFKDIIFNNIRDKYFKKVELANRQLAKSQASNRTIALIPRLIIELILFISLIMFVLFLFVFKAEGLENIITKLFIFLIIALKIIPTFQNIYSNHTQIIGNISSFEKIKKYLKNDTRFSKDKIFIDKIKSLELKQINFSYSSNKRILNRLNLYINENETIGIMGESGQGKSTLVDIISTLNKPTNGEIFIDNKKLINNGSFKAWQNQISYVSQNSVLLDDTIKNNITFFETKYFDESAINEKLEKVIKDSQLSEFVKNLPRGLDTIGPPIIIFHFDGAPSHQL